MTKNITITVRFQIEETDVGSAAKLLTDLKAYLTSDEAPLQADYGKDAWGGYEGAYITEATILEGRVTS